MKFHLLTFNIQDDYLEFKYTIPGSPGFLDMIVKLDENKLFIEQILSSLCKLYKVDEITLFSKNLMYKTYNGYYSTYKRF